MEKHPVDKTVSPMDYLPALVLLLLTVWGFFYYVSAVMPFIADDAFITFRYSENLARGYGPTFNPGGQPVEGYTTFLWMLLMTIPHFAGISVVFFSKALGIIFAIATLIVVWIFASRACPFLPPRYRIYPGLIAAFLLATFYPSAVHAVSGMETSLFTFLLILLFLQSMIYLDNPDPRRATAFAITAILTGLARPEGNIVVWVIALTMLIFAGKNRAAFIRSFIFFYIIPGVIYYVWRYWYYGLPLPLPAYVKGVYGSQNPGVLHGLQPVMQFLEIMTIYFGIPILIGLVGLGGRLLPAILGVITFLLFFLFPYHAMSFTFRFLYPIVPMLFVIAAIGLGLIFTWTRDRLNAYSKPGGIIAAFLILFICWILAGSTMSTARVGIAEAVRYGNALRNVHIRLGKALALISEPMHGIREMVLATPDAGAVPYYSGWTTIDTGGLNDRTIATTDVDIGEYVVSRNPNLVIINSTTRDVFTPNVPFEGPLFDACMEHGMRPAVSIDFMGSYYLWLMTYPDGGFTEYLRRLEF
jgi:arabinofuranosyltransferase